MDIVKIGGSLLTDKTAYRKFFQKKASTIIQNLIHLEDFILVHGGGSFGHYISERYGLPGEISDERIRAASIVKYDMTDLNQKIVKMLNTRNRPSIGISPFFLHSHEDFNYDIVRETIKNGIIPVLYGDVYFRDGFLDILSGDSIMVSLARIFKPRRAIFMSDVDGVYDRDPKKYRDATLMNTYSSESVSFGTISNDVTGGMELKFKSMIQCRDMGVKTYLINGNYPERIDTIGTKEFMGTEFV
ncbi:MAG: isopentenyl phosphate kinase [Cuniculiplasma sp.]